MYTSMLHFSRYELSRLDHCNDEVQGQFINLLKIERFILKWHTTEYKSQIQSP